MSDTAVETPVDRGTVTRLAIHRDRLRNAVKTLTTERDQARQERDNAIKERDTLKTAQTANESGPAQKKVKELEAKLRERDHKDAYKRIAEEKGIRKDALEDAWKLSGYEPNGEPDEDAIAELIDSQIEAKGYLKGEVATGTDTAKPGAGTGQGGKRTSKRDPDPDYIPDHDARWRDASWQMNNQEAIRKSAEAKLRMMENGTYQQMP
jgi:hypothetical protein